MIVEEELVCPTCGVKEPAYLGRQEYLLKFSCSGCGCTFFTDNHGKVPE
jgi:hypothetical protein